MLDFELFFNLPFLRLFEKILKLSLPSWVISSGLECWKWILDLLFNDDFGLLLRLLDFEVIDYLLVSLMNRYILFFLKHLLTFLIDFRLLFELFELPFCAQQLYALFELFPACGIFKKPVNCCVQNCLCYVEPRRVELFVVPFWRKVCKQILVEVVVLLIVLLDHGVHLRIFLAFIKLLACPKVKFQFLFVCS